MDFITQYTLWTTAQTKAASIPGLSVTVNDVEGRVECKAGATVFYSSTSLTEIHIALDTAIAVYNILNP